MKEQIDWKFVNLINGRLADFWHFKKQKFLKLFSAFRRTVWKIREFKENASANVLNMKNSQNDEIFVTFFSNIRLNCPKIIK